MDRNSRRGSTIYRVVVIVSIYFLGSSTTVRCIGPTELSSECGRVPIFEKIYGRSINVTLEGQPRRSDTNQTDGDFRILYGLDAVIGEWPWIVRIKLCTHSRNCHYCTGSLIDSRWVLSAGHCGKLAGIKIRVAQLGLYDIVSPDKTSFDVNIDKVIVHPEYYDMNNDLALFRLARQVEFNTYVQPVCLVGRETKNLISYAEKRRCYAIGYGLTEGMNFAVKLQKLRINTRSPDECNSDQLNDLELRRGTVCVGPSNDKKMGSSCKGDSGGPNLCYDAGSNSWQLFGTVSYGPSDCDREAGDRWLSVAVDITSYRTWILSTIGADK